MLIQLTNTPRDYAWGSQDGIATFTGREASGRPEAELWFGTHSGSPATVVRTIPESTQVHATLADWLHANPSLLGNDGAAELPILLKVLAAARPLSLQVHPTPEQARAGFDAENERGIALDSPKRNYKDPRAKPEIIVAVTEFDALCGFRPASEVAELISELGAIGDAHAESIAPLLNILSDPGNLEVAVRWLLSGGALVLDLLDSLVELASSEDARKGSRGADFATLSELARFYPGDPGIVIAMLMNRVRLAPGECLFAPAGMLHAYLSGVGIELMSASDNVVRGGLTDKHIDIDELVSLLRFDQEPARLCAPSTLRSGAQVYAPPAPFTLTRLDPKARPASIRSDGPSLLLVEEGSLKVEGSAASGTFDKGDALFVTADEFPLRLRGRGRVWIATAT